MEKGRDGRERSVVQKLANKWCIAPRLITTQLGLIRNELL